MKVWITTVGRSPFAVINPIWMVCRNGEFIPERVYLIWNDAVIDIKQAVEDSIKVILNKYGISKPEIVADENVKVREDDFKQFKKVLRKICDKELKEENEVAIDMTPGRKFMSALSMAIGLVKKVHRIYYLHLVNERKYQNKALVLIPFTLQKLYDLRRELYEASER